MRRALLSLHSDFILGENYVVVEMTPSLLLTNVSNRVNEKPARKPINLVIGKMSFLLLILYFLQSLLFASLMNRSWLWIWLIYGFTILNVVYSYVLVDIGLDNNVGKSSREAPLTSSLADSDQRKNNAVGFLLLTLVEVLIVSDLFSAHETLGLYLTLLFHVFLYWIHLNNIRDSSSYSSLYTTKVLDLRKQLFPRGLYNQIIQFDIPDLKLQLCRALSREKGYLLAGNEFHPNFYRIILLMLLFNHWFIFSEDTFCAVVLDVIYILAFFLGKLSLFMPRSKKSPTDAWDSLPPSNPGSFSCVYYLIYLFIS
jgi:hypothetical protein